MPIGMRVKQRASLCTPFFLPGGKREEKRYVGTPHTPPGWVPPLGLPLKLTPMGFVPWTPT